MKAQRTRLAAVALLVGGTVAWLAGQAQAPSGGVVVLTLADAIGPATSDYITKGIAEAETRGAELVVIEMDTPGGLDSSMREIIQAILDADVPVATFVYPEGARAASAGAYILYASHIAAMAPATNVGSATPVAIGGTPQPDSPDPLAAPDEPSEGDDAAGSQPGTSPGYAPATASERKAINDAVAYIRSLAELRGRNADWAESAVREAANLSANAALAANVIDLIAEDRAALLRALDGRIVDGRRLALPPTVAVIELEPDWRTRLLAVISNPNVAVMLMMLGIYGLIFEGYNPGAIVPGVVGAIAILLALYAFQVLPINYAGLALIILGVVLILAEFLVPSFGALGIGGIAAFVFGALILFDTEVPGFEVARSLIGGIAFTSALALFGTVWLAMRARSHKVVSGIEEMQGLPAEALEDFEREGQVWVHGERWLARTSGPVVKGQMLTVRKVDGLVLLVDPAAGQQ